MSFIREVMLAADRLRYEERLPSKTLVRAVIPESVAVHIGREISEQVNTGNRRQVIDAAYVRKYFEFYHIEIQVGKQIPTVDLTKEREFRWTE